MFATRLTEMRQGIRQAQPRNDTTNTATTSTSTRTNLTSSIQLFHRLPLVITRMIGEEYLTQKEIVAFGRTNRDDVFTPIKNRLNCQRMKYWLYYVPPIMEKQKKQQQKLQQQQQQKEEDLMYVRVYLVDVHPRRPYFNLALHTVARSRIEPTSDYNEWSAAHQATLKWTITERQWRIGRDTNIELDYWRIGDGLTPPSRAHITEDQLKLDAIIRRLFNFECLPSASIQQLTLPDWFHYVGWGQGHPSSDDLPSLTHLTKLHTIEFIHPSSLKIRQLMCVVDTESISQWPPSLRTLRIASREFDPGTSAYWPSDHNGSSTIESLYFPDTLTEIDIRVGNSDCSESPSLLSYPPPKKLHLPNELLSLHFERLPFEFLTEKDRLPQSLTYLVMPASFNNSSITTFPRDLTRLHFGQDYNQDLSSILIWPSHLTHISFGRHFMQSLVDVKFPATLEHLEFSEKNRNRVRDVTLLPNLSHTKLHTLILSRTEFILPDPSALPSTLCTLHFGESLDERLNQFPSASHLPVNLTELNFGDGFNTMMMRTLPEKLRKLYFGFEFNQPLIAPYFTFPSTLEILSFNSVAVSVQGGAYYLWHNSGPRGHMSHPMPESLGCTQLRSLSLPQAWNQPLKDLHLPLTLRELVWSVRQTGLQEVFYLPQQLERLIFEGPFVHSMNNIILPSTLRHLEFTIKESRMNEPLPSLQHTQLETLILSYEWNQDPCLLFLPSTLTHLQFGEGFRQSLAGLDLSATTSLSRLILPPTFNASLPQLDATRITILQLPRDFNDASFVTTRLPTTLHTLEFGSRFNQSISGLILPSGLKKLQFGLDFDQTLADLQLPPSLQIFAIGTPSNEWTKFHDLDSLAALEFPSSIRTLVLPDPRTYLHVNNYEPTPESIVAYSEAVEEWRRYVSRVSTLKYHFLRY